MTSAVVSHRFNWPQFLRQMPSQDNMTQDRQTHNRPKAQGATRQNVFPTCTESQRSQSTTDRQKQSDNFCFAKHGRLMQTGSLQSLSVDVNASFKQQSATIHAHKHSHMHYISLSLAISHQRHPLAYTRSMLLCSINEWNIKQIQVPYYQQRTAEMLQL